ncbi:MAG: hypothetical protein JKY52_19500 [Flavobacteriales bacterium]|nr:hypothetical protein [Flavobacteriales bacterium]
MIKDNNPLSLTKKYKDHGLSKSLLQSHLLKDETLSYFFPVESFTEKSPSRMLTFLHNFILNDVNKRKAQFRSQVSRKRKQISVCLGKLHPFFWPNEALEFPLTSRLVQFGKTEKEPDWLHSDSDVDSVADMEERKEKVSKGE